MGWLGLAFAALSCSVFLGPTRGARVTSRSCIRPAHSDTTVYNFTLPDLLETRNVSLSEYEGKILLLDNEFHVLGFPCNQFGQQEPGGNGQEIMNGVRYVRPGNGFLPNFPIFKKIDVNGEKEHPLYTFIKEAAYTPLEY
ncbi:Glutathione peroxidase 1 [Araneus ventricosus]|uniref:Glutathione peroxidase 1 n=1 Tax=Araneus ventricosus TaxID=182803 RepID=A0A4Y2RS68_ARAVE|nr:Glutathione peroxidase 1 [Araneus ventricosus]